MANKINDQTFDQMVHEIFELTKNYEDFKIKHLPYVDSISKIYERYGVSKELFAREVERRLGKPSIIRSKKT